MATELPAALGIWIDKHQGIVQPYALAALVDLWMSERSKVTLRVSAAPPPPAPAPPVQPIAPQAAIVDTGIPDLVERLARGGLRMVGACGGGGGPCQIYVVADGSQGA